MYFLYNKNIDKKYYNVLKLKYLFKMSKSLRIFAVSNRKTNI